MKSYEIGKSRHYYVGNNFAKSKNFVTKIHYFSLLNNVANIFNNYNQLLQILRNRG